VQIRSAQLTVMVRVLRVRELRRVEAGYVAFSFSEHATWLAVLVYAMQRGGAREVGIVAVVQLLPGIVLAPFAAYGGDRFPPHRALAVGYAAQSASMMATAIAMAAGAPMAAYVAAACAATCITFTRPVMSALLPTITHAPSDLVAANVVTGFIEQIGVFAGPLLAGVLMAVSTPALVFAVAGASTAIGCVMVLGLDRTVEALPRLEVGAATVVSQVFAGFATLRREGRLRVLIGLGAGAAFVKGIGDVIFVTFADGRLDGGGGQSGLLAGAYGLGALVGAVAVTRLIHSGAVTKQFLVSGLLAAAPLLALGAIGRLGPALVAFAVLGAGETLLQLTSWITVQRQSPPHVLARVFGILEGLQMAAIALGSLAVTVLVTWTSFGVGLALLAGVVLLMVVGGVHRLRRHGDDLPVVDDALVQRLLADPVFAPLPAPTVERVARSVEQVSFDAGDTMVAEGATGDRYYIVLDGAASVSVGGRTVRELGPSSSFGEIALLRDVPRTAAVTATTPVQLLGVPREAFLEAVTGHPRSLGAASEVVDRYLAD
jgi:predicted MFS family arabinose efflux permease